MRRALYDFFGLPRIPDVEPIEEVEAEGIVEAEIELDPIIIPQPVRSQQHPSIQDMSFHDLGEKRFLDWAKKWARLNKKD